MKDNLEKIRTCTAEYWFAFGSAMSLLLSNCFV